MQLRGLAAMAMVAAMGTLSTTGASARQGEFTAKADIKGDGISGTAVLREITAMRGGATDPKCPIGTHAVEIVLSVTGLKPGPHGVHLHAVGKCEAPGFTTAGGHFDPGPATNADPDMNHPFHMGDRPNLIARATGAATMTAMTTRVTIAAGPLSIFDADGTAIIIHPNPDQGITGEA
jgi:Cu-Zn family superoxide dismutase